MPAMAGPIAAPAMPLTTCVAATVRKPGTNKITSEASVIAVPATTTSVRLARV